MKNMADKAIDGSSFFKVFLDKDRFHKSMRIPPDFWKMKMNGKKCGGDIVYLKCRGDQYTTWQVNLVKDESSSSSSSSSSGLRFSGPGWSKFVNDNSICSGDFATFKLYDDDVTFKVTIFDPSCCEKQLPPYNDLHQKMEIKSESDYDDLQAVAAVDPFFTAIIKGYNISDFLRIPMKFVREYMKMDLEERRRVIVWCQGKEWEVSVVRNNSNYCYFGTGWRLFVRDNQINVGDICNFHLRHFFRFHVTISRAIAN